VNAFRRVIQSNVFFVAFAIIPQWGLAAFTAHMPPFVGWIGFIHAAYIWSYLLMPCRDKRFGDKRPLHWVRQTIFAVAGVAACLITLTGLLR
jgi:hypothetical protein